MHSLDALLDAEMEDCSCPGCGSREYKETLDEDGLCAWCQRDGCTPEAQSRDCYCDAHPDEEETILNAGEN